MQTTTVKRIHKIRQLAKEQAIALPPLEELKPIQLFQLQLELEQRAQYYEAIQHDFNFSRSRAI